MLPNTSRGARTALNFPVYLRVFGISVHPHLVLETLSYAIAFQLFLRLRRTYGDSVPALERTWVATAATVGAAFGSRMLFWLEDPAQTLLHWRDANYLIGGKTIVGALLCGWAAVEVTKWFLHVTSRTGDLFAVPLCVGIAIGRIGCFLTGLSDHTFGNPTSLPWGVDFGDGIRRHPTQIYELIFVVVLAAALWRWMRRPHTNGDIFKGFMVAYLGWRLAVDFLKPAVPIAGLTGIQWACVAGLFVCAPDMLRWARHLTTPSDHKAADGAELASNG